MLEEPARIIRVNGDYAEVETRTQIGCERCASGRGCGAGTLAQAFGSSTQENVTVRLADEIAANTHEGDIVSVGLDERAVVTGSIVLYVVPLISMIACAILATLLSAHELFTILAAAIGFAVGLLCVHRFSRQAGENPRYEPVALRLLPASAWYGCEPTAASAT